MIKEPSTMVITSFAVLPETVVTFENQAELK
jgi:hypothetical protein